MKEGERADFLDHLDELRTRIIRSIIYVGVLMIVGWVFFEPAYHLIMRPVEAAARISGGKTMFTNPLEPFWVRAQVSMILGLILSGPLLLWEVWAFVSPGLTRRERGAAVPLLLASALLGLGGAAFCYLLSFRIFHWTAGLAPQGVEARFQMSTTILQVPKLMLAFALCFQLPVIIILLVKVGVVSPAFLAGRRKEAVLAIVLLAAVVTPTGDPLTLFMLTAPLYLLYEGTVAVARIIYRRKAAALARAAASPDQGG